MKANKQSTIAPAPRWSSDFVRTFLRKTVTHGQRCAHGVSQTPTTSKVQQASELALSERRHQPPVKMLLDFFLLYAAWVRPGGAPFSQLHKGGKQRRVDGEDVA